MADVETGARLGGWTLSWRIGAGSGGAVYRAEHADGRVAAVKVATSPGPRFEQEQELLRTLGHPAFPRWIEALPGAYAMELVAGRSLDAVARGWNATLAAGLLAQVADALDALHRAGFVHRDVAGRNILVERGGRARLLDLGSVARIGELDSGGARRRAPDGATTPEGDAWALGALFYALLTGEEPEGSGPFDPGGAEPLRATIRGLTAPAASARPALGSLQAPTTLQAVYSGTLGVGAGEPPPRLGRYLLLEELGRGGMGVVWRAWDPTLQRAVALKSAPGGDADAIVREAQAAGALDHPALCRVYDAGVDDGLPYLAMELVAGSTLAERLRLGPLGAAAAVELVARVGEGLAVAHAAGLVHRDVKPGNVLLDEQERPKLSDFGLVTGAGVDAGSGILGTPRYMAPEQARGEPATPRSDVYALGVVLHECLSGRTPHEGGPVIDRVASGPGTPLREHVRVDGELEAIVGKACAFDPRERYADADALVADLRRWQRGEPVVALPSTRRRRARWWARRHAGALRVAAGTLLVVGMVGAGRVAWGAIAARRATERAETEAAAALAEAAPIVAARRAEDPEAAAALFDQIARAPGLQGTHALTEAWLAEAEARADGESRRQALAQAWLSAPEDLRIPVLERIADGADVELRAAVGGLVAALGGAGPLVRDEALEVRDLANPAVVGEPELGALVSSWSRARPLDGPVPAAWRGWNLVHGALTHDGAPVDVPPDTKGLGLVDDDVLVSTMDAVYRRPAAGGAWTLLRGGLGGPAVDLESPTLADLDGDGLDELALAGTFWRGWELQVHGARDVRMRFGAANIAGVIPTPAREVMIVASKRSFGSRIVFPGSDPYGEPSGVVVLGLRDGRFERLGEVAAGRVVEDAHVGDLDGDGLADAVMSVYGGGVVVLRQRPGERFVGTYVGGITARGLVQADDDPAMEVIGAADGGGWVFGAGDTALPALPRVTTRIPAEADPELRRALELAALGFVDDAGRRLEALRLIPGEVGARAALYAARLTVGGAADTLYDEAARVPSVAPEARASARAAAIADLRLADAQRYGGGTPDPGQRVTIDLRGPLPEGWRVGTAGSVRWGGADGGQRLAAWREGEQLRLPVDIVDPVARVEADVRVPYIEWGGIWGLRLLDDAGHVLGATILPTRGGRQAVRVGIVCADQTLTDDRHLVDAPRPALGSPWWIAIGPTTRCGIGRQRGADNPGFPLPLGPGWLVVDGTTSLGLATLTLTELRMWGLRPREAPEVDPAGLARVALARLDPERALSTAPAGSVEAALARLDLGLPADDAIAAVWRDTPGQLPRLLRVAGPEWGAWLRRHDPDAWIHTWWRAWSDPIWQHPDDPLVREHLVDDLPDAPQLAGKLDLPSSVKLLLFRGRALRVEGQLAAAAAHQELAFARARQQLAAARTDAERGDVHDELALITPERAALALLRGDRDGALAAVREGLSTTPLPGYLADGLAEHPLLATLNPELHALLQATPGWEGP